MTSTLDANVLLYASNQDAPEWERARSLVDHLAAGPALVVLLWPVLMGYLRISTHPRVFRTPLAPAEAIANVEALLALPHVRAGGEDEGFWPRYRHVADAIPVRGNLVPDAHIAALMQAHGVASIWSRDRDLRKFDGITVRDPFAERYARGFG